MQCQLMVDGKQLRITLTGQLIFSDTAPFAEILQQVRDLAPQSCVVQLDGLDHIDSSGLRMLLLTYDLCRDIGTPLDFRGAVGQVREMLLHCRFETLVSING